MKQQAYSAVIVSLGDSIELRHTVNSVVRSMKSAGLSPGSSIIIFDESKKIGSAYTVDEYALPVIHSLQKSEPKLAQFVSVIPEGELVSRDWTQKSQVTLENHPDVSFVRPELYITWGELSPTIWRQARSLSPLYSILEPAYSSIVAMTRELFLSTVPRVEDVSRLLSTGQPWQQLTCSIVQETVAFSHQNALPFLPESTIQALGKTPIAKADSQNSHSNQPASETFSKFKNVGKRAVIKGLRSTNLLEKARQFIPQKQPVQTLLPSWLVEEWKQLHRIENRLFPSRYLLENLHIQDRPSHANQVVARAYYELIRGLQKNTYDYILFAPWLIRGGADKFTVEYANTIAKLRPHTSVLVVTTLEKNSEWAEKLNENVDYCDFGNSTATLSEAHQYKLLETLLIHCQAKLVHIVNSELAYNFVASHKAWLLAQNTKVIATSFSQEVTSSGRVLGYSHTHVPEIYEIATCITSDNKTVAEMWEHDYGFDINKIHVHHLPFPVSEHHTPKQHKSSMPLRVLWASRLSPEKLPELVKEIATALHSNDITIDMYGSPSPADDMAYLDSLPSNVRYLGAFDGMNTLPLHEYDAFLYTSLFDGMPNTLLEIGSAGLPIVASAVGGIPELIENERTGLLVIDTLNARSYALVLERLQDDYELGRKLASALREKIEQTYSQEQFEQAVNSMLKQAKL